MDIKDIEKLEMWLECQENDDDFDVYDYINVEIVNEYMEETI